MRGPCLEETPLYNLCSNITLTPMPYHLYCQLHPNCRSQKQQRPRRQAGLDSHELL